MGGESAIQVGVARVYVNGGKTDGWYLLMVVLTRDARSSHRSVVTARVAMQSKKRARAVMLLVAPVLATKKGKLSPLVFQFPSVFAW